MRRRSPLSLPVAGLLAAALIFGAGRMARAQVVPKIGFEKTSSSGLEGVTAVKIHVVLDQPTTATVTVHYSVTGGTATRGATAAAGVDYILSDGDLTFPAKSVGQDISIQVIDDPVGEPDETIALALSSPTNATFDANITHTYTILNDDPIPKISFKTASASGLENITSVSAHVLLDTPATAPVTVHYAITGGTATPGTAPGGNVDFILSDGDLTFPPGVTDLAIPITVINDSRAENDETIELTLSAPVNGILGAAPAFTYTIVNDDAGNPVVPSIAFQFDGSSAPEKVTAAPIHILLSDVAADTVKVKYGVIGGTATRGTVPTLGVDYILADGTLTFPPGVTDKAIPLTIVNDPLPEDDETIVLQLSAPQNGTLGSPTIHTYTIVDDDNGKKSPPSSSTPPQVGFQTPSSSGSEGDTPAKLTVILDKPATGTVTVDYAATGGTATGGGVDYTLSPGTLSFAIGETTKTISIAVIDDALNEPDETIQVTLTNVHGANLSLIPQHAYTIIDNDPIAASFVDAGSTETEGDKTIPIKVAINAKSTAAVTVDYLVSGTAQSGVDYTLDNGTVTFPAGETTETVNLKLLQNDVPGPNVTVVLTLNNPTSCTLGPIQVNTQTILENGPLLPLVQFATDSAKDFESVTPVKVEVDLTSASAKAVSVDFTTSGTAVSGKDHTFPLSGTVTFDPGVTQQFIQGDIIDNSVVNADKTIIFALQNPKGLRLGSPKVFTYWILDDDASSVTLALFKQDFGADGGKVLTVIGPKALTVNPRGIAVDKAGNYYISDRGDGTAGGGSILMVPKGSRDALRIITGLNDPGDVEMSADQRSLVVVEAGGNISRHPFGVSVKLSAGGVQFSGGIVYVKGTEGTKQAKISPDGYFHIPNVLTLGEVGVVVDIVIERAGKTKTFYGVPLGQPGFSGAPFGETLSTLQFDQ